MSDNKNSILNQLHQLGLDYDEAKIYLELLREPNTHLRLSVVTGINRTKVYRLVENLEKRSLVARHTDDKGTFLVASDPTTLEVAIVTHEEKIKQLRTTFTQLLPTLESLKVQNGSAFVVRTYEGIEGLKQMCWHELQTCGELLSLGGQTIEDLITNRRWAEKHRALSVEAGYSIREIINHDVDLPTFTNNQEYMKRYQYRQMPSNLVFFSEQITIYNDTVAVYHWRENQKVGVEIVSKTYAHAMRSLFNQYWELAKSSTAT